MKDSMGVDIRPDDTVMVTAWGYGARKYDVGVRSRIFDFNLTTITIRDPDGNARRVNGRVVSVVRRDGKPGFEHNRDRDE